jgi:hypothetical protein
MNAGGFSLVSLSFSDYGNPSGLFLYAGEKKPVPKYQDFLSSDFRPPAPRTELAVQTDFVGPNA